MEYLLASPGIVVDEFNVDGYTPLMTAAEKGNERIFDRLLAAGANPTVRNARGLDAPAVARRVIAQQETFLRKLQQRSAAH